MRTYTMLVSIVTHLVAVCAIVVVTVTATDVLPEVRRALDYVEVTPPRVAIPAPTPKTQPVIREAAQPPFPVEVPEGINPEPPPVEPVADVPVDTIIVPDAGGISFEPIVEPPPPPPHVPVRVGGQIKPPSKIAAAAPVYPQIARAAGVQGIVILEAVIGEDGTVREVRPLKSIPLLDQAAIDAVRQWRFTPTLLNGVAVPVVMSVTVSFSLR